MNDIENLAKILKELRKSHGYTTVYIAKQMNITHQSYQAYESGKTVPTLANFIKLAELYDISLDELIGRKEI